MSIFFGCAPSKPPTTSLKLQFTQKAPEDSVVYIDEENLGPIEHVVRRGVALPPGRHRLTVEAKGYFPVDKEIDAGDSGGVLRLPIQLTKIPE